MKQVFNVNGQVVIEEVPAPGITPNMVLVATCASLISAGTEAASIEVASQGLIRRALAQPTKTIRSMRRLIAQGPGPMLDVIRSKLTTYEPLGYSASGQVIAVGADISDLVVGDRVACGGVGYACHAELIAVPRLLAARVPDGVSWESGAYTTVGTIALQSVRRLEPTFGEYIVVFGLGLLGQLVTQVLRANGCRVLGIDLDLHRVMVAQRIGGAALPAQPMAAVIARVQEETGGNGADGAIVAAASPDSEPVNEAVRLCRKRGRVVLVGTTQLNLDRDALYRRELDLRMATSYGPGRYDPAYEEHGLDYPFPHVRWTENRNMEAFLDLLRTQRVAVEPLTQLRVPVSEASSAYERLRSDTPRPIGVILTYPEARTYASGEPPPRTIALPRQSLAPSRGPSRVRIGLIGVSAFARDVVLTSLRRMPDVELRVVASRDGGNAARAARRFSIPLATTSPDEVIGDSDLDAVFVTTRHSNHAALALRALEAGKHVFLEKPMAVQEADALRLAQAAAESQLRFTVGFNRRFAPLVSQLRESFNQVAGPWLLHYRVNALKLPPGHWQYEPMEGGGRIIGEACHFLDLLWFLVGKPPIEVTAYQAVGQAGDHPANEDVQVLLRFPDGSVAHLLYTALGDSALPKERLEVFRGGQAATLDNFERLTMYQGGREHRVRLGSVDKGHRGQFEAFVRAVRDPNFVHPIGPKEALVTTILTLRAQESAGGAGSMTLDWS